MDRWQVFETLKREYGQQHRILDGKELMYLFPEIDSSELEEGYMEFFTLMQREGEQWLM